MDINSGPKIVGKIWCEDPDQHLRVAEGETRRGAGLGVEGEKSEKGYVESRIK